MRFKLKECYFLILNWAKKIEKMLCCSLFSCKLKEPSICSLKSSFGFDQADKHQAKRNPKNPKNNHYVTKSSHSSILKINKHLNVPITIQNYDEIMIERPVHWAHFFTFCCPVCIVRKYKTCLPLLYSRKLDQYNESLNVWSIEELSSKKFSSPTFSDHSLSGLKLDCELFGWWSPN